MQKKILLVIKIIWSYQRNLRTHIFHQKQIGSTEIAEKETGIFTGKNLTFSFFYIIHIELRTHCLATPTLLLIIRFSGVLTIFSLQRTRSGKVGRGLLSCFLYFFLFFRFPTEHYCSKTGTENKVKVSSRSFVSIKVNQIWNVPYIYTTFFGSQILLLYSCYNKCSNGHVSSITNLFPRLFLLFYVLGFDIQAIFIIISFSVGRKSSFYYCYYNARNFFCRL